MPVYTIADLHLSLGDDKPMDIFPGWEHHIRRIRENWLSRIAHTDTVVIPGDISWAMSLQSAVQDFAFIDSLPGKKLLGKGNHDYWWTTHAKMQRFLDENAFSSIAFLHNNCHIVEHLAICGTRGWSPGEGDCHDTKMQNREYERLLLSLNSAQKLAPDLEKVVFLHYPPLAHNQPPSNLVAAMAQWGVRRCYYGHLHAEAIRRAVQGEIDGICYRMVSADSLHFAPWLL